MSTSTAIDNTEIKYDRITKDYAVLVDGVAVAYGRNYSDAEAKRTAYLADRDAECMSATAEELDGGQCSGFGCVDGCADCASADAAYLQAVAECPDIICPVCGGDAHDAWNTCPGKPIELFVQARARVAARRASAIALDDDPAPGIENEPSEPPVYPAPNGYTTTPAYRLQINRVIINTQAALRVPCRLCKGDHLTQHCSSIRARLGATSFVAADICQAPDCIQAVTHDDVRYCCYHYSEHVTGVPCDCTDDDYEDAMWESAHGSYSGATPLDVDFAPVGWAA